MLDEARAIVDFDPLVTALQVSAMLLYLDGDPQGARALLKEIRAPMIGSQTRLAECCRILILCGAPDHAERLANQSRQGPPLFEYEVISARAHVAEATGDLDGALQLYREAADRWRTFGNPLELAHALAGQARVLEFLDRSAEPARHLDELATLTDALHLAGPIAPARLTLSGTTV